MDNIITLNAEEREALKRVLVVANSLLTLKDVSGRIAQLEIDIKVLQDRLDA